MKHALIKSLGALAFMPVVENLRLGEMAKGEVIPEGVYHVRIAKHERKVSQPSPENPDPWPYEAFTYVITCSAPEEFHGRHVFENCTYAPGKNFSLRQVGEALGYGEDTDLLPILEAQGLIDGELLIAVGIEKEREDKKTGKTYPERNNVKKRMALNA